MFWNKKRRSPDDLEQEIASHLAHEADDVRDQGTSSDPESAARRAFGNITALHEASYESKHWLWLDHLKLDLRQAIRQFKHRRAFSAMVILTLALGIGATSSIFSVLNAVLLRPLPYKDPSQLAMIYSGDSARELHEGRTSLPTFTDWKNQNHSFEDMTIFTGQTFLLGTDGSPERMRSARVPANFWSILGAHPILGRVFTPEEEKQAERVVVLSYPVWQERFGGQNNAIGASLRMDDRKYRVIGVMAAAFRFPFPDTKVWEPVTAHPYWTMRDRQSPRSNYWGLVVGRLKPGVAPAVAEQEMSAIERRLQTEYSSSELPGTVSVVPLDLVSVARYRLSLWLLFGSVSVMLLIACANAAGLLLARGSAREREFAVRRALGARRLRLAAQLLTETFVLSAAGGLLGLLAAVTISRAIKQFGPADIPRIAETSIDWRVLLFAATVTAFATIFAGLWPIFGSVRTKVGSRQWTSISTHRLRNLLVASQFALALVLISSSALLIHSFLRVRAVELGYHPDHLLSMRIDLHVGRSIEEQNAYFEKAVERAESLPGVTSAAAAEGFLATDPEDSVQIEGRSLQHPGPCEDLIEGNLFKTAGVPLLAGRVFSSQDQRHTLPVAIINQTMARSYWPNGNPIGKHFRFTPTDPWLTVVGVTGDMRRQGIERAIAPQVFRPHRQGEDNMMDLVVRTTGDPKTVAPLIRSEIQAIDKSVAKFKIEVVEDQLASQISNRRFDTFLLGSFAFAALFLSSIGVYGLLHQLVVQRKNEIGVRMALGASPRTVLAMILRQGLSLALAGTAVGLIAALSLSHLLSNLLFDISPTDPSAFAASVIVLLAVAAIGCWIPSGRASRIDPMLVLRDD